MGSRSKRGVNAVLDAGDIQLGAVEIKEGSTDLGAHVGQQAAVAPSPYNFVAVGGHTDETPAKDASLKFDANKRLYTLAFNPQTAVDDTETPLVASDSYTATAFLTNTYGRIFGTVFADQDGTLYVEQTNDSVNYDAVTAIPVTGGTGVGFSVTAVAALARVRYVNGGVAQGAFRLYTNLGAT